MSSDDKNSILVTPSKALTDKSGIVTWKYIASTEKRRKIRNINDQADNEFLLFEAGISKELKSVASKSKSVKEAKVNQKLFITPVGMNSLSQDNNKNFSFKSTSTENLKNSFDRLVNGLTNGEQPKKRRLDYQMYTKQAVDQKHGTPVFPKAVTTIKNTTAKPRKDYCFLNTPCKSDRATNEYYISGSVKTNEVYESGRRIEISLKNRADVILSIVLSGLWLESIIKLRDEVNVIWSEPFVGIMDEEIIKELIKEDIEVSDRKNFLVINPQILISPSQITEGITCLRRSYLSNFITQFVPKKSTTLGNVRHSLVELLFSEFFAHTKSNLSCNNILARLFYDEDILLSLFSVGVKFDEILEKFKKTFYVILTWLKKYKSPSFQNLDTTRRGLNSKFSMKGLLNVEEMIWSSIWGIKGKLDLVAKAEFIADKKLIINYPTVLELKTGANVSKEHHAQVILYKLLVEDRYFYRFEEQLGIGTNMTNFGGVLLHLRDELNAYEISFKRIELCWLIHTRNKIATFVSSPKDITSFTGNKTGECVRCYNRDSCVLSFFANTRPESFDAGLRKLGMENIVAARDLVTAIADDSFAYFQKYLSAINEEEEHSLLLDQAASQECFTASLVSYRPTPEGSFLYKFGLQIPITSQVMTDAIKVGTHMIIGYKGHPKLLSGTVLLVEVANTLAQITIKSESRISFNINNSNWQELIAENSADWKLSYKSLVYSSFRKMRGNLCAVMCSTKAAKTLRRRLLYKELPEKESKRKLTTVLENISEELKLQFNNLTSNQKEAITAILEAKNFTCVQGLPGCGKTTVLSLAIRILYELNFRILVTAYTHNAVDNLLNRIRKENNSLKILRVGSKRTKEKTFSLPGASSAEEKFANCKIFLENLKEFTKEKQLIVGVTALSADNNFLSKMKFDYCFVDEASQINEPTVLAPLLLAKKFILVGDHNQLAPLTRSKKAAALNLSLLKRMFEKFTDFPVLRQQFRMTKRLLLLNNYLFSSLFPLKQYFDENFYLSGSHLNTKYYNSSKYHGKNLSISRAVAPDKSFSFIEATSVDHSIDISLSLAEELYLNGLNKESLAILCIYNKVVAATIEKQEKNRALIFRASLQSQQPKEDNYIVSTVDKFQGQEKDVVILNLTCLHDPKDSKKSQLLGDWRRLYVAFSRSRYKLIVIGSSVEFQKYDVLSKLFRDTISLGQLIEYVEKESV